MVGFAMLLVDIKQHIISATMHVTILMSHQQRLKEDKRSF
jgi:hypothetical protein